MNTIADMLSPEAREALVTAARPAIEACACLTLTAGFNTLPDSTLAVHATCGRPTARALEVLGKAYAERLTPEAVDNATPAKVLEVVVPPAKVPDLSPVTVINGVEVDLRSEARFQTICADCHTSLAVDVRPSGPDGVPVPVEVLTSKPRTAVCLPCGEIRVRSLQQPVVIHKPIPEEENVDLSTLSNAHLSALAIQAREAMTAKAADEVRTNVLLAQLEPDTKAKVDALVEALDVTPAVAYQRLVASGVVGGAK